MGPSIKKFIILIMVSLFVKPQLQLIRAQQQVPGMFLYGDSQFDNGNNNLLITTAKSNYQPYGIDFPIGPTGRFTNGLNIPDFLAQQLGFSKTISPFATARDQDILRGVNYASGGAGILDESGSIVGARITMNEQLQNHRTTVGRVTVLLKFNQTAVNDYLSKCLYVVNIGSNDYLNNYYLPGSVSRLLYTPDRFAQKLIQKLSEQLRTLYKVGARKVAVFGAGLLGCVPQVLANFPTNGMPCVDFINNGVQVFNTRLPPLIDTLNRNLPNARFILINITNIALGDPSLAGVLVTNVSCCPTVRSTGLCVPNRATCRDRNTYIFWDNFHPTEIANRATARRAFIPLSPSDSYPGGIQNLVLEQ